MTTDGIMPAAMPPTKHPGPLPAEIKAAREAAGLTQKQAGELIHGTLRGWQDYEYGKRPMHPGLWELFKLKVSSRSV